MVPPLVPCPMAWPHGSDHGPLPHGLALGHLPHGPAPWSGQLALAPLPGPNFQGSSTRHDEPWKLDRFS